MAKSVFFFAQYDDTDVLIQITYISTFLHHENIPFHQSYAIFVLALKDLVSRTYGWASMQVQIKILLVAKHTQTNLRVDTKKCLHFDALSNYFCEKFSCYIF